MVATERKWPKLIDKLNNNPAIALGESGDVERNFVKLTCEAGSAVCDEQQAFESLVSVAF